MIGDFVSASAGIIDGNKGNAFKVLLTVSNGTLRFQNFRKGDTFTVVIQEDASGSNFGLTFPTSALFAGKVAPNRDTTANAFMILEFTFNGTNYIESAAPTRLPSRVASAALGTIVGVGVVILTLVSSNNGVGTGRVGSAGFKDQAQYITGTGANAETVAKRTASGSDVIGSSGALVVGSPTLNEKGTDAKFYVAPNGNTTVKGTASASTLFVTGIATAGIGHGTCFKTGKQIGYCSTVLDSGGACTCN